MQFIAQSSWWPKSNRILFMFVENMRLAKVEALIEGLEECAFRTRLPFRWQTSATQCLAPTVLYTDVDSQCDKIWPDNGHKFTTLTVHISSSSTIVQPLTEDERTAARHATFPAG